MKESLVLSGRAYKYLSARTFSATELRSDILGIDERYQRAELKPKVHELIAILEKDGSVPDPIWVAKRPDGTLWIVDGQQRYWAHWHVGKALRARIHAVESWETERQIFHILNDRKTIDAAHRALTWPGSGGDIVRWMQTNNRSALAGALGERTHSRVPASTIAKTILVALTGTDSGWPIAGVMKKLDVTVGNNPKRAQRTAELLAAIIAGVFRDKKVPALAARAIGRACWDVWHEKRLNQAWPTPSQAEISKLRRVNWRALTPGQDHRYLPVVIEEIRNRWKIARSRSNGKQTANG
jgi:hypothetical protein